MQCMFMAGTFRTPNCHGFDLRFYVSDFIQSLAKTVRDAATKGDPLCIQMDGAVNPYLLQAGILAAGLDGVANDRDPGKPST